MYHMYLTHFRIEVRQYSGIKRIQNSHLVLSKDMCINYVHEIMCINICA